MSETPHAKRRSACISRSISPELVGCWRKVAQQKTMQVEAGILIEPDNVTLRVDRSRGRYRPKGRRYIDGCIGALAQQKTMQATTDIVNVKTNDISFRVDPDRVKKRCSWYAERRKGTPVEQKTIPATAVIVVADNVAFGVDPIQVRIIPYAGRYIDGGKLAPAQQKAMRIAAAVTVVPDNVTLRVDRIRFRLRAKGRRYIDGCELLGTTGSRYSRR